MKQMLKGFLCIMLLASGLSTWSARADNNSCASNNNDDCDTFVECADHHGDVCGGKTHFSLRPQDSNLARRMTAVEDKIHRYGVEEFNGVVSLGLQYQATYNGDKIAKYLFGKERLSYGPTCDGTYDIYGPNIGTSGTGTISFEPRIRNFIADVDLWLGLDEFICGLWARIDVPVNWTQWDLRPCQQIEVNGNDVPFAPGAVDFVSAGTIASTNAGALEALRGGKFGIVPAATAGKLCCENGKVGRTHDTAVAGLHFDLGYDFIRRECGHFGASLHFVAPTGTRPTDECLFQAVSGAQHSWQIGATVTASYLAWENCDGDQRLGIFFDSQFTHLFDAKQRRLFNLKKRDGCVNPLSYWMLVKKFDPTNGEVVGIDRVANLTHCNVKVGAKVMADLALMLQYDCGCFSTGLGWNFWVRSAERLQRDNSCRDNNANACRDESARGCLFPANTYALKGDLPLDPTDSRSESNSTVGTCATPDSSTVFLRNADIDYCSGLHPRAHSNKIFGWLGWNWRDCEWQPFLAVEGGAEFGHNNTAADQWEVMLKGGVAF